MSSSNFFRRCFFESPQSDLHTDLKSDRFVNTNKYTKALTNIQLQMTIRDLRVAKINRVERRKKNKKLLNLHSILVTKHQPQYVPRTVLAVLSLATYSLIVDYRKIGSQNSVFFNTLGRTRDCFRAL